MGRPVKGPCGGCGASDGDCYNLVVHMRQGVCCSYCYHPLVPDPPLRPDWDEYFLAIAKTVATRADCTRRQVGCVLVDADHRIIGTGYNGSEPGGPSCLAGECPRGQLTYDEVKAYSSYDDGPGKCHSTHAEMNALLFARTSCKGATAYVTYAPCPTCDKALLAAGVSRVVVGG